VSAVPEGREPDPVDERREDYLFKKLDEVRKDCQWLLGLGAVGVFGVAIKDGFGMTAPDLRYWTLAISMLQILTAMFGSMAKWESAVNVANTIEVLERRLRTRYFIRNIAVLLLAATFVLIAILGWMTPATTK
jgi:hypothetical protein